MEAGGGRGVGAEDADALACGFGELGVVPGAAHHRLVPEVVVDDVALAAAFVSFPADEVQALEEGDRFGDGRRADLETLDEFGRGEAAGVGGVEAHQHPGHHLRQARMHDHGGQHLLVLAHGLGIASVGLRGPRPLGRGMPPPVGAAFGGAVGQVGAVRGRAAVSHLAASDYRLAADALLLARACELRIGELLDLELDCVHQIGGHRSWLKVPLGKLDTERMVPLDDETVILLDRIVATRTPGRPLPHPRTGRPCEFLFTHHGRRLSQTALRAELARSAATAGIGHVTPHALRHTYAPALVNAGVSLQALMALLGHVSAEMSLRYARLFDTTVRAEYERALDLAKGQLGPLPPPSTGRKLIPVTTDSVD